MKVLSCPKCREETLERKEPLVYKRHEDEETPLYPARCTRCKGVWLTRDEINQWRAGDGVLEISASEEPPADLEVDRKAGLCPDCGRILVRAPLDHLAPADGDEDEEGEHARFYLDRCANCGGIWFDHGEWNELAADDELDDLSRLWDPEWQRRRVEERNRRAYLERLEERLGADLFAVVQDLLARLREEPRLKGPVLAHLREELGEQMSEPGADGLEALLE
jgi:Zn-finger nucleic acid-binding protein